MAKPRFDRETDYAFDMAVYIRMISDQGDNSGTVDKLKRNLTTALQEDVTEKQRLYLSLYYGEGLNMREIGERLGVAGCTVSRVIKAGKSNLRRCLRYGAAELLERENDNADNH